jgi:hypothetical protein
MPQELLFELNGARVTPHIATFGGTSYQIANIASVHVARRKKYNPLAVIIFLLGLGILAAAIVKSHVTELVEESRNKEFVFNVQKAVEQAFVARARQPPGSEA